MERIPPDQGKKLTKKKKAKIARMDHNSKRLLAWYQKRYPSAVPAGYNPSAFPKGVPKSFLLEQKYQFPNTNTKWTKSTAENSNESPQTAIPESTIEGQAEEEPMQQETQETERYSPTDTYMDNETDPEDNEELYELGSEEWDNSKQKNVFERLGPPQPKKPNLTINLLYDQDHTDRKVLVADEDTDKYTPTHLREYIQSSIDPIVLKYLPQWPWKKPAAVRNEITANYYTNASSYEKEQIADEYDKWDTFVQVTVTGYPSSWDREDVLDTIIENLKGKIIIPCFVEFSEDKCKFLVLDSRESLMALHDRKLSIRKDEVILYITISLTYYSLNSLDFTPEIILRKLMTAGYDDELKLSLRAFTNKKDISHFIYFPLNRISHQNYLMQISGSIAWDYIVEMNLSRNKLTSIAGFNFLENMPKLKKLDLSHNLIDKMTAFLCCKGLDLKSIILEGNPVCSNYRDPRLYVEVLKKLFPGIRSIDGVRVPLNGEMPKFIRNYCSEEEKSIVNTLLEVYFPLLESSKDQRQRIQSMYDENAVLTITYRNKLRRTATYLNYQEMLIRSRSLEDGKVDTIEGDAVIARHITKWPELEHDPTTFTVDVIHHSATTTIVRVGGLLKLTKESLADDEHLLAFTKTFVLKPIDEFEYRIFNQMIYWDEPTKDYANSGFQINTVNNKKISLQLDCEPDDDLKERYIDLFMKLTNHDRIFCKKRLEEKSWHFKNALENFVMLSKIKSQ